MMSMPVLLDRRGSPEDLELLPSDGNRYECIDGALLVTPAPTEVHQRVLASLFARLRGYSRLHPGLTVLFSPADISLETDALTQPDLFAYRTPAGQLAGGWSAIRDLVLAVEVLSPGSIRDDRGRKLRYYQPLRRGLRRAVGRCVAASRRQPPPTANLSRHRSFPAPRVAALPASRRAAVRDRRPSRAR